MSFIALKTFPHYLATEQLADLYHILRVIKLKLKKCLFISMITINVIFIL